MKKAEKGKAEFVRKPSDKDDFKMFLRMAYGHVSERYQVDAEHLLSNADFKNFEMNFFDSREWLNGKGGWIDQARKVIKVINRTDTKKRTPK